MATLEGAVLDSLDINDGTTYRLHESLEIGPPSKRLLWLAGREGDALGDVPGYERRTVTAKVRIWNTASMDAALAALSTLVKKIQKAERTDGGIALVWTPAGSTKSRTIYVLAGEVTGLPINPTSADSGWFKARPMITLRLDCKPFLYDAETTPNLTDSDVFARDTLSEGRWVFDTGSGTLAVSSGTLVPSSTAEKILYRSISVEDVTVTAKFTTGATLTNHIMGVLSKRLDASNFIIALSQKSDNTLRVYKRDGGTYTSLASAAFTPGTATDYWLRLAIVGNVCTATVYTADPETGAAATQTAAATLTAGDATKFGTGIKGKAGIRLTPGDTAYRADGWLLTSAWFESSEPQIDAEIRAVPGEVAAEGRIILTDAATQTRAFAEVGRETLLYDSTAPGPTLIDSDQLSVSGLAGTANTRSGAYDPLAAGNSVIRGTTSPNWVGLCETATLSNIGTYRVKARVWTDATDAQIRAAYKTGDTPLTRLDPVVPQQSSAWIEVDLGVIDVRTAAIGTQQLIVRIEFIAATGAKTLDIDYLELIPAEGYAKARAPITIGTPSVFSARSEFDTESGAITGDSLATGGTWTGAGDADDFSVAGGVATRVAVSDAGGIQAGRLITASTPTLTATAVAVDFKQSSVLLASACAASGVVFRYADISNFACVYFIPGAGGSAIIEFDIRVAASNTIVATAFVPPAVADRNYRLTVVADAAGNVSAFLDSKPVLTTQSTALATGGALASGKAGIFDTLSGASANTRTYNNFAAWVPDSDAAIYSGRDIQFRWDDTLRANSAGTIYGRPPVPRGARMFIPAAGAESKITRLVAKAARSDIEGFLRDQVADALRVEARVRARSLVAPS